MPFGIPPSVPVAQAATDYANAATSELNELVQAVVTPIIAQVEAIETAIGVYTRAISKAMRRESGSAAKQVADVSDIVSDMIGYVAQETSNYVAQLSALAMAPAPADGAPQEGLALPGTAPVTPTVSAAAHRAPAKIPPRQAPPIAPPTASPPPPVAPAPHLPATATIQDGLTLLNDPDPAALPSYTVAQKQAKSDALELLISQGAQLSWPLPPAVLSWINGDPPGSEQGGYCYSIPASPPPPPFVPLPPAPVLSTTFPCPAPPDGWTGNRGVMGSIGWCEGTQQILDWLQLVGAQIQQWIIDNVHPNLWASYMGDLVADASGSGIAVDFQHSVHELLKLIGEFAGRSVLTIIDIVKCTSYYTSILTPINQPGAYAACLIIKNIIAWVRSIRLGTQSYSGFTVATVLQLPQLEQFIDRLLDYMCCTTVPTYADAAEAYIRGRMERPQLECLLRLNGLDPSLYMPFIEARGEQLSPRDAIQYARRNHLHEADRVRMLRRAGVIDPGVANDLQVLYDELPTVADHLHWLQKGIFIPGYVEKYGLDAGFEQFYSGKIKDDLHAQGYTEYRAQQEYYAHWQQPGPDQLREFVYRLRPKFDGDPQAFTVEDYQRLLVEQEYAPKAREWLARTVYRIPAIGYLRDMYRSGVIDDAELKGYHADLGYSLDDSERFVQIDKRLKARQNARMGSGWSPAALRRAVSIGAMPERDVAPLLAEQGFAANVSAQLVERAKSDLQYRVVSRALSTELSQSVAVVRQSQAAGIMSESDAATALASLGFPVSRAAGVARLNAAAARVSRIKGAVSRIRHAFEAGEIDADYVRQSLLTLGIVAGAIDDYLQVWRIEMTPRRKRLSASQIVSEVVAGAIDQAEAHVRLSNLGYDAADQALLLADAARQTVTTPEALAQLALEPTAQSGPALAQLGDKLIGLSKKVVAQLKQAEPAAKLGKWLKVGIVDAGYVRHRLRLYGWDDSSIEKWVQEYGPEQKETSAPEGADG